MKFITVASFFSFAMVALVHATSIPEEQNLAVVEDVPEGVEKDSHKADAFDFEDFWTKMMADAPKREKEKSIKGDKKKPRLDFGKLLNDLMKDLKKDDGKGGDDLTNLFKDLKGLDFKGLLDDILKKPEKEGEKLEV